MPSPRITEILVYLDDQRAALRAAAAAVPASRADVRPAADRWSVTEILEHLSIVETRIAKLIAREIAAGRAGRLGPERDESSVFLTTDVERFVDRTQPLTTGEASRPTSSLTIEAAWAALEASRAALRAALLDGDGLALGERVQPHPFMGPLNLYQWALFVGGHEARHARQILEIG